MTDKEKARAYDKALDRCKEWASGTCEQSVNNSPKDIAEFIFPQLAESEDEKIREFLIGILSQGTWRKEWPFSPNEVVAYLERQNHVQSDTEKEYVRTLKSLIFNFLSGKDEVDRDYYQRIEDWLDGRHVEKKEQESTNVLEDAFKYYTDRGITISCGDFKAEPKKEQKSTEWSEEDEGELQNTIDALEFLGKKGVYKSESGYDAALQAASWLKSIPERINLQPKQEWNEEDEKELDCIINILDRLGYEEFCKSSRDKDIEEERFYYKEIQFLKRLKSLSAKIK